MSYVGRGHSRGYAMDQEDELQNSGSEQAKGPNMLKLKKHNLFLYTQDSGPNVFPQQEHVL